MLRDVLGSSRFALGAVLILHTIATFVFYPPTELLKEEPIWSKDYPVHVHRVHLYRQALLESGVPWGYDPAVSAGAVTDPVRDVGAKPMQVLGVLLPFLSAGQVVKVFLLLSVLALPVWIVLASRRFGATLYETAWITLASVAPIWLVERLFNMMTHGLLGFLSAAYVSVLVLALYVGYLKRPTRRTYVKLVLGSIALFLLHVLGPALILPAMLILALRPGVRWVQRGMLLLVPLFVLVANAFWIVPFYLTRRGLPRYAEPAPENPPDVPLHMTIENVSDLIGRITQPHYAALIVLGIGLAVYGWYVMRKRLPFASMVAIGVTVFFGFALTFGGSFIEFFAQMQPTRFMTPTIAFLAIPAGMVAAELVRLTRLAAVPVLLLVIAGTVGYAVYSDKPVRHEDPRDLEGLPAYLTEQTSPDDRLAIQSRDGYRMREYQYKAFPMAFDREVIGSNFPIINDPPQFLRTMLMGRLFEDWDPDELRASLQRWGISLVLTRTSDAEVLMEATLGPPVREVGYYEVYRVPTSGGRFLLGSGTVEASINRIDLTDLHTEEGWVVLRYRYHPAWKAPEGVRIERVFIPEDPAGFIGLLNPPADLTLRFDPWAMLSAPWPEAVDVSALRDTAL